MPKSSSNKRTLTYNGDGQFVCSDGTVVPRGGKLEVDSDEAQRLLDGPFEFVERTKVTLGSSEPQAEKAKGTTEEEGS